MPFDPTKPVMTRDGRPARIICTDRRAPASGHNIIALVTEGIGEFTWHFYSDGSHIKNTISRNDLVNIPVKRSGWINIYEDNNGPWFHDIYDTKEIAIEKSKLPNGLFPKQYITTIQIEWTE